MISLLEPKVAFSFEDSLDDCGPLRLHGKPSPNGGIRYVDGVRGKAIQFDRSYFEVGATGLDFSQGASIEFWIKTEKLTFKECRSLAIVEMGSLLFGVDFFPSMKPMVSAYLGTAKNGSGVLSRDRPLPADQWVHLAMVYDPCRQRLALYMNGELAQEVGGVDQAVGAVDVLRVGQDLPGMVDEIRIFERPISLEQIRASATTPDSPPARCPNLLQPLEGQPGWPRVPVEP